MGLDGCLVSTHCSVPLSTPETFVHYEIMKCGGCLLSAKFAQGQKANLNMDPIPQDLDSFS